MIHPELVRYIPKLISKRNSMPLYITFYVTNRCNLKCEHCFYSAELNQPTQQLTLEEIEKMAKSMDPFPVLLYGGGEPFLRTDIAEITSLFYKYNKIKYLAIPTNGTYTAQTKEAIEKMCTACPDTTIILGFSIDGLEEEHNRIRGSPISFKRALETFHAMKELQKKHKNLRLGFITTFTATNQDHMEQLYDYLKAQSPDNITINLIRGTPKNPLVKNVDISKYKAIVAKVKKDLLDVTLPGFDEFAAAMSSYKYDMVAKTYEDNQYQTVCYSSRISGVVYPNGDVYPCEMLDKSKMIGNIRDFDMDFRKLWMSQHNKEIADWIVGTKCFCTHECNVHCNLAFNAKHFVKIAGKALLLKSKKAFAR